MSTMSQGQLQALVIAPTVTGSISFIASATIMIMILKSKVKLSTVYRRLVFGMSFFDLFQSFEQATSTFLMPEWYPVWGAHGTSGTCIMKAFLNTLGIVGANFYNLSISVYFALAIKTRIKEDTLKRRFEPIFHIIPVALSMGSAFFLLFTHNYGPTGLSCWITPTPPNCHLSPDIECESYGNPIVLRWMYGAVIFLAFGCNCILLLLIWHAHYVNAKKNQRYIASWMQGSSQPTSTSALSESQAFRKKNSIANYISGSKRSLNSAAARRGDQILFRAVGYVIGFFLTYTWTIIYRILLKNTPYCIIFLSRAMIPLQGFFNIIVFTSAHVLAYHRDHPELSWLQATWHVFMSGGDNDNTPRSRRTQRDTRLRRKSLRKEPIYLDKNDCDMIVERTRKEGPDEKLNNSVSFEDQSLDLAADLEMLAVEETDEIMLNGSSSDSTQEKCLQ